MPPYVPLDSSFSPPALDLLQRAGRAAHDAGIGLYLVGGSVRDTLLGLPVLDLDLVAEAGARPAAEALLNTIDGRVLAASQFGTLKLEMAGCSVDLAMARRERYPRPGALPVVEPATLEEDLCRRDFSINSMAVALAPERWGALVDPTGGAEDLRRKQTRALHEESFRDDATRILRAVRYSVRLGFRLQRRTSDWLRRDLRYLETISAARLRHELERMLGEARAAAFLARSHRMGVLAAIDLSLGEPQVAWALRKARRKPREPLALLGMLTYPGDALAAEAVSRRLGVTARQRRVLREVQRIKDLEQELALSGLAPHRVVAQLEDAPPEAIEAVAALTTSRVVGRRLRSYLDCWRGLRPWLRGTDLLRMGVPPGPAVGQLLGEIRNLRLDGRICNRHGEMAFVRSLLSR